jgi:hypothetical protein
MGRMGHSTRAALIYQHRTAERDRLIAAAISAAVEAEIPPLTGPKSQNNIIRQCSPERMVLTYSRPTEGMAK